MVSGAEKKNVEKASIMSRASNANEIESPMFAFIPISKLIAMLSKSLHPKGIHAMKKIHKGYNIRKVILTKSSFCVIFFIFCFKPGDCQEYKP